jgi:hypothetical protein
MKNPLTRTVRRVMRKHGRTNIWTNLRKSVRTVKCYSTDATNQDIRIICDIVSELNAIGVTNEMYTIYKTDPKLSSYHLPGLIVSFPL